RKIERTDEIRFIAEPNPRVAILGCKNAGNFVFLKGRKRAGKKAIALAEDDIAREYTCEFFHVRRVHTPAHKEVAARGRVRVRVLIEGCDSDLVETISVHPPAVSGLFCIAASRHTGGAEQAANRIVDNGSGRRSLFGL